VLAYLFERFPKFSQTFCYREIAELFRQGVRPVIFSLRAPDRGPELNWDPAIVSAVHQLPEGDAFARLADEASATEFVRSFVLPAFEPSSVPIGR